MKYPKFYLLLFFSSISLLGNTQIITTEHIRENWDFKEVMRPSKNDAAIHSKIYIKENSPISSCLSLDGLHNGVLPQECRLLRDFFCFTNDNASGGKIAMDLGKIMPISMINSYSAHGPVGGTTWCNEFEGERGPQVYTLYGSSSVNPDFDNLQSLEWIQIAHVDTRPKNTEDDWVGQYGVNIKGENNQLLGNFRWIVWDIKPTLKENVNPCWTNTWYTELDVHTPETLLSGGDAILAGTQLKEIIIAYKTHFDIGFTHPAPEIVNVYRTSMIDQALDIIDEFSLLPPEKRFSWTIPSWVAYQILWEGQDPVRRKRITDAIKSGSIVIHGLPVTVHTESMSLQDLVFGLSFNKAISEDLDIPMSRSGKLTDIPSHSWIWPTIFKNAGMDFLQIGTNPTNERPVVPLLYYWEGPDGSRLLTMHPQGYGSDTEFGHGLYPPIDWPYEHWLAMLVTSDNVGPPRPSDVQRILDEAERNLPGVNIRLGKMEDFADAIFKEEQEGAFVPVVRSDMPDCWIHGVGSMPVEDALAHKTRVDLTSVEILNSHLPAWKLPYENIQQELFTAHERSMMYGEHTFGGARNLSGKKAYSIDDFESFVKTDSTCIWLTKTWEDHANYIKEAATITDSLSSHMMTQLANAVNIKGERIVVYNPLPYERNAIIDIPGSEGEQFIAEKIPPCGYKTYKLGEIKKVKNKDEKDIDYKVIENKYLKIKIDRVRGGITSIINKEDNRELVSSESPHAFGQYIYQRFDSIQNRKYHLGCNHLNTVYGSNGRACWGWNTRADLPASPEYQSAVAEYEKMDYTETNIAQVITLQAKAKGIIQSKVTTTITLPHESPWLEISIQLDDKKPDYWPEAGSIYLPVNADSPQFRIGRIGSFVNPETDFIRGSNRTYGYVNTGAIVADKAGKGVGICPLDHGLMSFGEKGLCTIDPDYVPDTPLALVNMFNTIWTINFPYWIEGSVTSRVRLWATNDLESSSLIVPATDMLTPVMTGYSSSQKGTLPQSSSGIHLSRKGVRITSCNYDSNILQLWESTGESGDLIVTLPKGMNFTTATPANLRGEVIGKPLPIKNDQFSFFLKHWSPSTFLLK